MHNCQSIRRHCCDKIPDVNHETVILYEVVVSGALPSLSYTPSWNAQEQHYDLPVSKVN